MGDLVRAGKIRYVGVSNETPWGVTEFVNVAERHGLPRIATIQNPYNLVNRSFEQGLDETCFRTEVSLLAYSPLGFGQLTGKYLTGDANHPVFNPDAVGRLTRFSLTGARATCEPRRWRPPRVPGTRPRARDVGRHIGTGMVLFALVYRQHDHRRHGPCAT
jgi:aryl-alcohol dehydrogenase-like predicted oxidoreductase